MPISALPSAWLSAVRGAFENEEPSSNFISAISQRIAANAPPGAMSAENGGVTRVVPSLRPFASKNVRSKDCVTIVFVVETAIEGTYTSPSSAAVHVSIVAAADCFNTVPTIVTGADRAGTEATKTASAVANAAIALRAERMPACCGRARGVLLRGLERPQLCRCELDFARGDVLFEMRER